MPPLLVLRDRTLVVHHCVFPKTVAPSILYFVFPQSKTLACHCRSRHCSLINTDFHRFSHKPSSFGLVSLSKREQLLRRTVQRMAWTFDTKCSEGKRKRSIISAGSKDTDLGKDWPVNGHNIWCIEGKWKRVFDWLHALGPDCIFKVDTIRCKWALGHRAGLGPLRKSILHVFLFA